VSFVAGNLAFGGAERQLFYLATALRRAGAKVRVLCLTKGDFWEHRLKETGVSVTWVGQHASRLRRLTHIVSRLRHDCPSVVQSHHFYTNLYVVAAARVLGLREVGAVRNDAYCEVAFTGTLGPLSLRAPRLLAANSRAGADNAVALGVPAHRVRLLANVVDTDQFAPAARSEHGSLRLLAIGMRAEKRVDRFLALVSRLRSQARLPVTAAIVGDGPDRRKWEQRAIELGLPPEIVSFTGARPVTADVYGAADVLVMTSDFEGTPNVILEAMASGLPVVAYRTGGVPEVVKHQETGYVADLGDEDSMTEYVLRLSANSDLRERMGRQARRDVETHYALNRLPGILSRFYEEVMS
jgi:glycosyltransferase involved in cell wall biosynthesis